MFNFGQPFYGNCQLIILYIILRKLLFKPVTELNGKQVIFYKVDLEALHSPKLKPNS